MVAAQATRNATAKPPTVKSPAKAKPAATTSRNTATATKAENTSGPFCEVRRSTLELYFSMGEAFWSASRKAFSVRFFTAITSFAGKGATGHQRAQAGRRYPRQGG